VAATNWSEIAKKENLDEMAIELRKLEDTVKEIHDEMLFLRKREEEMRNLNGALSAACLQRWLHLFLDHRTCKCYKTVCSPVRPYCLATISQNSPS
jgi:predicted RNase H-like nuclease